MRKTRVLFCYLVLIFNWMLFDGIFQIYQHVYVFGFVFFYQLVLSFIIHFIFGHINVFHLFQFILHHQQKQKNLRKNLVLYVRRIDFYNQKTIHFFFSNIRLALVSCILLLYWIIFLYSSSLYSCRKLSNCYKNNYSY